MEEEDHRYKTMQCSLSSFLAYAHRTLFQNFVSEVYFKTLISPIKPRLRSGKRVRLRRIPSGLVVLLLFLGLSIFTFNFQPAKAQFGGTIIINPDGSISSPVPANITTSDNVTYTFTGNNYLPIVVDRSNIIINGKGYTVQGLDEPSAQNIISLTSVSNVTIKNTTITNSFTAILLDHSSTATKRSSNQETTRTSTSLARRARKQ
jgi:hypothetical protein